MALLNSHWPIVPATDSYLTIASPISAELNIQGSRFIALCSPAETAADVQHILDTTRKEYPDATHHCYAYRLGIEGNLFRTVDDGEPSGTAGRPILSAIDKRGLTNVVAVVTRYFGGTKLGVGGLTRAYAKAAGDAMGKADVVERFIEERIAVSFPHPRTSIVMRIAARNGARILATEYDDGVRITLAIRAGRRHDLVASLIDETGGQADVSGPLPPSELPPS